MLCKAKERVVHLTQEKVSDVEDHAEGELGSEKGQEPLRGIHMSLQIQILEVRPQIWKLLLHTEEKTNK